MQKFPRRKRWEKCKDVRKKNYVKNLSVIHSFNYALQLETRQSQNIGDYSFSPCPNQKKYNNLKSTRLDFWAKLPLIGKVHLVARLYLAVENQIKLHIHIVLMGTVFYLSIGDEYTSRYPRSSFSQRKHNLLTYTHMHMCVCVCVLIPPQMHVFFCLCVYTYPPTYVYIFLSKRVTSILLRLAITIFSDYSQ